MKWLIHHGEGSFGSSFGSETFRGVCVSIRSRSCGVHRPQSIVFPCQVQNVELKSIQVGPGITACLAIQHVAGKDNILADALSHMPVGEPP